PNIIGFFIAAADLPRHIPSSWSTIIMPHELDKKQCIVLADTLNLMNKEQAEYCMRLFGNAGLSTISLDTACLLLQYSAIMGTKNMPLFCESWLPLLVEP